MTLRAIQTAFRPGGETTDPERFAGRRAEIEHGCRLLLARDHIFLHGVRGIGKSSLARQLELIASGDTRLLARLGSDLANESYEFATAFLVRDDSVRGVNHLLYRLLVDPNALAQWDAAPLQEYALEGGLNALLVAEFTRRVMRIASNVRDGVAIFIDEFERIPDRTGFASLVKAAPEKCVFIITGVAKTERELIQDHESVVRQLDTGKLLVDKMSTEELRAIIDTAANEVRDVLSFDPDAISRLVDLADGHPYLIHLFGQTTLLSAFRDRKRTIGVEAVEEALREIATGKRSNFLEDRYLKAIGNSPQRETLLRVFAESDADPVPTLTSYPVAKIRGVGNPSYYIGDLQKSQYGQEVEKVSEQYYRIIDPLFKAYVRATPTRLSRQDEAPKTELEHSTADVTLLHISDVHFGASHFFSNLAINTEFSVPDEDRPSLETSIIQAMDARDFELRPDLVFLSGDITQTGATVEFNQCLSLLRALRQHINGRVGEDTTRRILVIPGNHDVNWGIAKADPANRGMAFAPYIQFARDMGIEFQLGIPPERMFVVQDYRPAYPMVVAACNSNVLEGPDDHRGYIGDSQLEAIVVEMDRLDSQRETFRMVMFHHHLVPVPSVEAGLDEPGQTIRDAAHVKQKLLAANVRLVLHGHRHQPHIEHVGNGQDQMVILGAGSCGVIHAERGEQPLSFNKIIVRHKPHAVRIEIERFVFDATRRRWLPRAGDDFQLELVTRKVARS
ncbi:MAG TPA: metallophosphoesterase [Kofleriaceae bacterium]|nr:metallophosphoesterase [Kofleriaceae bacterium]